jgi:signal peptidase II
MAARAGLGRERRTIRWATFVGVAIVVIVADQVSKAWIDRSFPLATTGTPGGDFAGPTPVVGDLIRIAKTYNDGGIFGLFGTAAPVLAVASLAVIALIVFYQARAAREGPDLLSLTLGLLLGGAIGNLLDRVRFGYVIDFVDMGIGSFRWYTFNVADASISIAIVGLIALSLLGDRVLRLRRSQSVVPAPPAGSSDRAT